ncbi:MAG: DNA repair protein RecO [Candidatus Sungbacteria bacterium]|nr:DNA repair protein RecO [Candidatus Sungbacteria bacterium]
MFSYKTDAVVLSRLPRGEADALYTLYTREFGKVQAIAQGVKKESAKLRGHLEPLCLSSVQFVLGRNQERLTHATGIRGWSRIREDWEKITAAQNMLDLVQDHCFPGEKDTCVWNLLLESLLVLEEREFSQEVAVRFRDRLNVCLGVARSPSAA